MKNSFLIFYFFTILTSALLAESVQIQSKNITLDKNKINWKILPGEINQVEFSFWYWNRSLIWSSAILLLIIFAYYIRKKRYELGSNLPQLPS